MLKSIKSIKEPQPVKNWRGTLIIIVKIRFLKTETS